METVNIAKMAAPAMLFIMMVGMGLELKAKNFLDLWKFRSSILVGLVGQMLMLPLLGVFVTLSFELEPALALGVIILSLCPGGATSNMISFMLKADVALSVSLTIASSCLAFLSVPLLLNFALEHFETTTEIIRLPLADMAFRVFVTTIFPLSIGMLLRQRFPHIIRFVEKPLKFLGFSFLMIIIVGVLVAEHKLMLEYAGRIGLALLAMMGISMCGAYGFCRLFYLSRPQVKSIVTEIGIQNSALALMIAGMLGSSDLAVPAIFYSVMACVGALLMISLFWILRHKKSGVDAPAGKDSAGAVETLA